MSKTNKTDEEREVAINAMLARKKPEGDLSFNEETWWDIEERIQAFVVAFYREHQRYPTYTAIAKGVGIDKNTVSNHLNGADEVDELYRKRLKRLARLYSTKTMTALYNAAIKGNHNAAGMIINYGLGLGLNDKVTNDSNEDVKISITVEQAESIEDKIAKFQRSKDRDADLEIVEGEVINAHSNTKK